MELLIANKKQKNDKKELNECTICLDKPKDMVNVPCGHCFVVIVLKNHHIVIFVEKRYYINRRYLFNFPLILKLNAVNFLIYLVISTIKMPSPDYLIPDTIPIPESLPEDESRIFGIRLKPHQILSKIR